VFVSNVNCSCDVLKEYKLGFHLSDNALNVGPEVSFVCFSLPLAGD
jgi:hypothetical protein